MLKESTSYMIKICQICAEPITVDPCEIYAARNVSECGLTCSDVMLTYGKNSHQSVAMYCSAVAPPRRR